MKEIYFVKSFGLLVMIPAVSLTLWLMVLVMKTSKKNKKYHPEDGKCELYQVIGRLQQNISLIN